MPDMTARQIIRPHLSRSLTFDLSGGNNHETTDPETTIDSTGEFHTSIDLGIGEPGICCWRDTCLGSRAVQSEHNPVWRSPCRLVVDCKRSPPHPGPLPLVTAAFALGESPQACVGSGLRDQGGSAGDHCGVVRRASRGEVLFSGEQYARARRWREEVGAR
jgi:hypothetical protein